MVNFSMNSHFGEIHNAPRPRSPPARHDGCLVDLLINDQPQKGPRPHKKQTHTDVRGHPCTQAHIQQVTVRVLQAEALMQGTGSASGNSVLNFPGWTLQRNQNVQLTESEVVFIPEKVVSIPLWPTNQNSKYLLRVQHSVLHLPV